MPSVKSKRGARSSVQPSAPCRLPVPPKARPRTDVPVDMSRREAFLLLPPEERERRIQAFIDALAPAFADYSVDDFRADQHREAEHDG